MKSIAEIIKGRRSIRRYKTDTVDDETIHELLELATYAPSAGIATGQDKELMADLGISEEYEMTACIALGYPDESPEMPERKPPHVLKWIK